VCVCVCARVLVYERLCVYVYGGLFLCVQQGQSKNMHLFICACT